MRTCSVRVAVSWRLSMYVLAIVFAVLPSSRSQDATPVWRHSAAYTVSQTNRLRVHDEGSVDVVMSINFQVQPGTLLAGSHKSILFDTRIKSIEGDLVVATDGAGRGLPVSTSQKDGWSRVEFQFAEAVNGTVTPNYVVNLKYTVLNGICKGATGLQHFGLPWAHRWAVPVTASKYEIEFANENMGMSSVCIGGSGFSSRCGYDWMSIARTHASYEVPGTPHGVYFEWFSPNALADQRNCMAEPDGATMPTKAASLGTSSASVAASPSDGESLPQEEAASEANTTRLTVGIVAVSSSLLGVAACACAWKAPVRTIKGGKSKFVPDILAMTDIKSDDANTDTCSRTNATPEVKALADILDLDLESPPEPDVSESLQLRASCVGCFPSATRSRAADERMDMGARMAGIGSLGVSSMSSTPGAWTVMDELNTEEETLSLNPTVAVQVEHTLAAWNSVDDSLNLEGLQPKETKERKKPSPAKLAPLPAPVEEAVLQLQAPGASPARSEWEVMSDLHAEDISAIAAMTQKPFAATTYSNPALADASSYGDFATGYADACPHNQLSTDYGQAAWRVEDDYADPETAECRPSTIQRLPQLLHL